MTETDLRFRVGEQVVVTSHWTSKFGTIEGIQFNNAYECWDYFVFGERIQEKYLRLPTKEELKAYFL